MSSSAQLGEWRNESCTSMMSSAVSDIFGLLDDVATAAWGRQTHRESARPARRETDPAIRRTLPIVFPRHVLGFSMVAAVSKLPRRMTLDEFQAWVPPRSLAHWRWELVDGVTEAMAPASEPHGAIQAEIGRLLGNHLRAARPSCRVVANPGVALTIGAAYNKRIPDLGVTCSPRHGPFIDEPILLIEILSPSDVEKTRRNVWAYTTIPSVTEILTVSSTSMDAEVLRRGGDGAWREAVVVGADDVVALESVGFEVVLREFYGTSGVG